MWIRRASRGRLDFPLSCSEVAGTWAGFATAGVADCFVLDSAGGLLAAVVVDVWVSAGGVTVCPGGADAAGALARGEAILLEALEKFFSVRSGLRRRRVD